MSLQFPYREYSEPQLSIQFVECRLQIRVFADENEIFKSNRATKLLAIGRISPDSKHLQFELFVNVTSSSHLISIRSE